MISPLSGRRGASCGRGGRFIYYWKVIAAFYDLKVSEKLLTFVETTNNARKIFLVREKNYPRGKIIFSSWEKFFGSIRPFLRMVKRVDKV